DPRDDAAGEHGILGAGQGAAERRKVRLERPQFLAAGPARGAALEMGPRVRREPARQDVVGERAALHHRYKAGLRLPWSGFGLEDLLQPLERVVKPRAERDLARARDLRDRAVVELVE